MSEAVDPVTFEPLEDEPKSFVLHGTRINLSTLVHMLEQSIFTNPLTRAPITTEEASAIFDQAKAQVYEDGRPLFPQLPSSFPEWAKSVLVPKLYERRREREAANLGLVFQTSATRLLDKAIEVCEVGNGHPIDHRIGKVTMCVLKIHLLTHDFCPHGDPRPETVGTVFVRINQQIEAMYRTEDSRYVFVAVQRLTLVWRFAVAVGLDPAWRWRIQSIVDRNESMIQFTFPPPPVTEDVLMGRSHGHRLPIPRIIRFTPEGEHGSMDIEEEYDPLLELLRCDEELSEDDEDEDGGILDTPSSSSASTPLNALIDRGDEAAAIEAIRSGEVEIGLSGEVACSAARAGMFDLALVLESEFPNDIEPSTLNEWIDRATSVGITTVSNWMIIPRETAIRVLYRAVQIGCIDSIANRLLLNARLSPAALAASVQDAATLEQILRYAPPAFRTRRVTPLVST